MVTLPHIGSSFDRMIVGPMCARGGASGVKQAHLGWNG